MYRFNPGNCAFYPHNMKNSYIESGTWPDGGMDVDFDTFKRFKLELTPPGMTIGASVDGAPIWVQTLDQPTE